MWVVVLGVESDTFEDAERATITTALRTSLTKYSNIALLPTPTEQILDFVMELECGDIDAECFQRIADKYKADQVLYTDATGAGGLGATLVLAGAPDTAALTLHGAVPADELRYLLEPR